jgi:nicotinate-nucleotide adenylyltransferase
MVSLASAAHPALLPSDMELRRDGPSYTVETLESLARQRPQAELFLVIGSDAFADMGSWHQPARVAALCTLLVIERPGTPAAELAALPARVLRAAGVGLEVSSSAVRRLRRDGRSVRYLVPEPVADYIEKRELYR